jgi:molybdopterin-synthase adenylyltransferase
MAGSRAVSSRDRPIVTREFSVAFAGANHNELTNHLTRSDGQEDICFAAWRPSTGRTRDTAIVQEAILPREGERFVDRTAWFTGEYAFRACREAAALGGGVMLLHSHPGATTWQSALPGSADAESERKIANLAREMTSLPLIGLTLGTGSQTWSGRFWNQGKGRDVSHVDAASVRVLGESLRVGYQPDLRPVPIVQETQLRTIHSWGDAVQAHLARLRVLVVGAGSVGQLILEMLARTGVEQIAVMDFDSVESHNLDRLHGSSSFDAILCTSKVGLARRVTTSAATAAGFVMTPIETSVCEEEGMLTALDFDVIFSCVDRPWPRHVLNTIAYSDLIPVIDGGIRLEPAAGGGLRNAYWRSHVVGPGRTCMRCLDQYNVADIELERDGSLDDPSYAANLPTNSPLRSRQNVYAASLAAASALTNQFLSLVVTPSGFGDPGPRRFDLRQHRVEEMTASCVNGCSYRSQEGTGDSRRNPTGVHTAARNELARSRSARNRVSIRLARAVFELGQQTPRLSTTIAGFGK